MQPQLKQNGSQPFNYKGEIVLKISQAQTAQRITKVYNAHELESYKYYIAQYNTESA